MNKIKYKTLKKRHVSYDSLDFKRMELLFNDPFEICKPENARIFIHQHTSEHIDAYNDRLREAVYVPIYSTIVHYYADYIFAKELTVQQKNNKGDANFWENFSLKSDRLRKTSFQDALKITGTNALAFSSAWMGYDFPKKKTSEGASAADVEESGETQAYVFQIDAKEVIDYHYDSFNRLEWLKLERCFDAPSNPLDEQSFVIQEYKIWEMINGVACFSIFHCKKSPNKPLNDSDEFEVIASKVATTFDEIPIKKLEIPAGLNMKSKVSDMCAKLFRNQTTFEFAKRRAAYPTAFIKIADPYNSDSGGMESYNPSDTNKAQTTAQAAQSRGLIPLAEKDELGYLQADPGCFAQIASDLEHHANQIYQQANMLSQSVAATTMGAGRSAASKVMDNVSLNTAAEELGSIFRAFALEVYSAIARARGEDIEFEAYGLDNFQQTDQEVILKNALSLNAIQIPSKEFRKRMMLLCAVNMLPSLDRDAEALIKDEIDSAVDSEDENLYLNHESEEKETEKENKSEKINERNRTRTN